MKKKPRVQRQSGRHKTPEERAAAVADAISSKGRRTQASVAAEHGVPVGTLKSWVVRHWKANTTETRTNAQQRTRKVHVTMAFTAAEEALVRAAAQERGWCLSVGVRDMLLEYIEQGSRRRDA